MRVCVCVCVQLLIGFESGCIVLWDLKNKNAEFRYTCVEVCMRYVISLSLSVSVCVCVFLYKYVCLSFSFVLTIYNTNTYGKPIFCRNPRVENSDQ